MLNPLIAASGLLLLLAAPASPPEPIDWDTAASLIQQQRITVHVPRITVSRATLTVRTMRSVAMVEKKAEDCVKMEELAGFSVNRFDSVDLMLKNGSLLRVKLGNDCPALGFYNGFYVKANKDKKMCANRDSIRSRSGRQCAIQSFAALVPAR
ncbi:hypothetical protein RZN05_18020 [Sphingomonas sp. HF-S4]|uniref:Uncharacterized protein n=1 Tax=Sphingomonas agrestis TaxID=3080540 RepID=A0ABU3YBY1_9SPHN|nr:hypothetical protein [Sphingomonas sp. HF-S4]MDV3458900.1 hypothetical protein [Sphingomonas sp. HF-S4]